MATVELMTHATAAAAELKRQGDVWRTTDGRPAVVALLRRAMPATGGWWRFEDGSGLRVRNGAPLQIVNMIVDD